MSTAFAASSFTGSSLVVSKPASSIATVPVRAGGLSMRGRGGSRFRFSSWGGSSSSGKSGKNNGKYGGGFGSGEGKNGGGNGGSQPSASGGGGESSLPPFLLSLWNAYNSSLESSPILTKAMTSLVGFVLGDLLAQSLLSKDDLDLARVGRMAAFGFVVHGPVGHYFYGALDRLIPGTELWKVASKVGIDQVLWAPVFTVIFFSFLGALEGKKLPEIKKKIKEDTWTGVTGSWKVWPVVHAINFRFIPTEQRLLYINTIQVAYNVFLSFIGNNKQD